MCDEHLIMLVSEQENKLKQLSSEVVFVVVVSLAGWVILKNCGVGDSQENSFTHLIFLFMVRRVSNQLLNKISLEIYAS